MQKKTKEIQRAAGGAFRFGDFDLYPSERQLKKKSKAVTLSPKAFDALLILVRNAEHLVHRDQLIAALWPDTFVTDANLTNMIVSLRKVLGREAIQTVSKHGYRLTMAVVGEPGIEQANYATFLQAKELAVHRSLESVTRARDLFSMCVANDPKFAAAWAWLGRSCRFLEKHREGPSAARMELAQAALRRALTIDPHLASAHHFYTQLQADLGQSREAMVRLAERIATRGDDPESYAGLVQVLRYTGLLDESVEAHRRATSLDPTIITSVPHTHFLRGEYEATLDTYGGTRYYLDAAAWAARGDRRRAQSMLAERLPAMPLVVLMRGLMASLLDVLEGRRDQAITVMQKMDCAREPEVMFYIARHFAMIDAPAEAVRMVRQARESGFWSSVALTRDAVFEPLRRRADFKREVSGASRAEDESRLSLRRAGLALPSA
jgi:DNA-binding winged helix-turn-helix (wHTH) protein